MSGRRGFVAAIAIIAGLALLPFVREVVDFPVYYLVFLSAILFWAAQATSWNILSGYSGYFSFGQGAFFGAGVYATAVLTGRHGWDFFATLPVAAVVAVAVALGIGALAFRLRSLRGEVFALLTLAVPFIMASVARINPAIDGGQGIILPVPQVPDFIGGFQAFVYLVSLAVAVAAVGAAWWIARSRFGWALFAIHDAEAVAEGLGVPTFRYKMLAISVTGILAGIAGSVFAIQVGFVTVEGTFNLTVPLFVIVMSVLGGRSHWIGPAIGAALIVTLQDRLAASGFEGWSLIIMGLILVTLILVAPAGLVVRLRERPWPTLVTLVLVTVGLGVLGSWGQPLDWFAVGALAAAVVAFVPLPRRRTRAVTAEPMAASPDAIATDPAEAAIDDERAAHPAAAHPAPSMAVAGPATPPSPAAAGEPAGTVVVEVVDVARSFGGIRALDGVSLRVHEGEIVGLVGPNGSGKTTLVNLLSGAFAPTSGSIRIDGRETVGLAPHRISRLGVARTYQIPRPFGSMTVRDNVAMAIMFGRQPRSLEAAREAAKEHLDLVGLADRADARPDAINLHERQLLEMARAIATRPRILMLDEALAGLSPVEIDNAVEVVRRIHGSGVTIVLVEHLLRVVNQLATRIVVLDQGRLLAAGQPAVVMRDPAVVAAYLGRQAHA